MLVERKLYREIHTLLLTVIKTWPYGFGLFLFTQKKTKYEVLFFASTVLPTLPLSL